MAEEMNLREKYVKKYWELVSKRPGVCKTSRESVKESIITYDVKREMKYGGCTALERMCRYKKASDGFDCDVAELTVLQYAIAFPFVLDEGRTKQLQENNSKNELQFELAGKKVFAYRGDTMNSYATTIHEFFMQYPHEMEEVEAFLTHPKKRNGEVNEKRWGVREDSPYWRNRKVHWEQCYLDHFKYFETILPDSAKKFIELNHTIGNFFPVPFEQGGIEFNRPRGFQNPKIKDYWDLTLWHIYLWYQLTAVGKYEEADGHLLAIVKNKDSVEMCRKWLKSFGSWPSFVRANYMEAFVKDGYGEPKELWKGHFTRKGLPTTPGEFSEFFINTSTWIMERGNTIAQVIMGELESSSIDCPWKNQEKWGNLHVPTIKRKNGLTEQEKGDYI